ncbi:MAG: hypothetical protein ACYT04_67730, partial [Nostoc sp.]
MVRAFCPLITKDGQDAIGVNLTYKLGLARVPGLTPSPSPNFARGEQIYLVPLLPSREKGLGDEGKTSSQSRFFLKLTPMAFRLIP